MSLLRMVEASEGSIYIDSLAIRDMGLHDIRSRIAVIPQGLSYFSFIYYFYSLL